MNIVTWYCCATGQSLMVSSPNSLKIFKFIPYFKAQVHKMEYGGIWQLFKALRLLRWFEICKNLNSNEKEWDTWTYMTQPPSRSRLFFHDPELDRSKPPVIPQCLFFRLTFSFCFGRIPIKSLIIFQQHLIEQNVPNRDQTWWPRKSHQPSVTWLPNSNTGTIWLTVAMNFNKAWW